MRLPLRPRLETLEGRDCPSGTSLGVWTQGQTLNISGNSEWNVVQVIQDDVNDQISVVYGQLPHAPYANLVVNQAFYKSSQVSRIAVDLGAGDDNFEYRLAANTDLLYAKEVTVVGGEGNDNITVDVANTPAAVTDTRVSTPTLRAADGVRTADGTTITVPYLQAAGGATRLSEVQNNLKVGVDAGAGQDQAFVALGRVSGHTRVGVGVDMGVDQDRFWYAGYGSIGGDSTVTINATGNSGNDELYAAQYGDVLSALTLNVKGGDGDDQVLVEVQGQHSGKTTVSASGGKGGDVLTLSAAQASGAGLSLTATGDNGSDTAYLDGGFTLSSLEFAFELI